ncbi:MAG: class I tRNA ligase family protein [Myxococcota bacterium]
MGRGLRRPEYGASAAACAPAHDPRDRAFAAAVGLAPRPASDADPDAVARELARRGAGGPEVRFRLRDWSVGRQRRWGCPIPAVRCPACGTVPVPEAELPVRLEAPLQRPCPRCGGPAARETDTLDTFVCSSWYVFRYCDPHDDDAPFTREAVDRFVPVDVYVGGLDHAAQHMLYFRFVAKVLHGWGLIGADEPVTRFVANGMVLGADGQRMSKSKGTGVDPAEVIAAHGADPLRLAILADVPVARDVPWDEARLSAAERLLARWIAP